MSLHNFIQSILSIIAYIIINFVGITSKIKRVNFQTVIKEKQKRKNVIYAFWHGRQFLLVFAHKFENIAIMTSLSRDGELQTKILSKFGYDLVRGSHKKRGAAQATLELIKKIEQGQDVAFAVDGPHGPGFKVKDGVIFLAQKTGRVIIPVSASAKYKKEFNKAWDKYLLPFPFNRCVIVYGKPIEVSKTDNIEAKSKELEAELNNITYPN
ncbi:MAG: lysophospholipid acyltransferase family protein [Elusimicrobiota bacterium]|nr:lysophospholipid acyltransferase family protein [Elusimicrobiota bacterium]